MPEGARRSTTSFLVRRDDIRDCRVAAFEMPEPEAGQALLRVDAFGLTSNNVSYAVFGDAMSYWDFFPAEGAWGRIPVWGFATVERSEADGVDAGARAYGYLPPSTHLVVTPSHVSDAGFVDGSPHRAALPGAYQRYELTGSDPFYRPDTEDAQMLLRPLFFTSFLIDDQLADDGLVTRGPVLISSASSKTAIAAAFLLAQRDGVEVIGLTSPARAGFVDRLGIYSRSATYDSIDSLERAPATFVDVAGDRGVRRAVHSHLGDELIQSVAVGFTHWQELDGDEEALPGPSPAFFFAPDRVKKRSKDWGPAGLGASVADAWHPFAAWVGGWLDVIHGRGFDAVQSAYLDVLEGRVPPEAAHVLSLSAD